jgi:HD-like signal output (HDOD) protein
MNESLFTRIKSLPPLPESTARIQAICNDPDSSLGDLARVVEQDPMLTANLLKAANSPLYGFSREIKTLMQAVSLFGMATVRGFALASAVKNSLKVDLGPYNLTTDRFADLSQEQNALMVRWYSHVNRPMLDILSPAAFLVGIGRVVLAQEILKTGQSDRFMTLKEELGSFEAAEEELFSLRYEDVSAEVFQHWRFEPVMVEAIRASADPQASTPEIRPYGIALSVVQKAINLPDGPNSTSFTAAIEEAQSHEVPHDMLEATGRVMGHL